MVANVFVRKRAGGPARGRRLAVAEEADEHESEGLLLDFDCCEVAAKELDEFVIDYLHDMFAHAKALWGFLAKRSILYVLRE